MEYGLMQRMRGSEITGEPDVGNILSIYVEALGRATSIDVGIET